MSTKGLPVVVRRVMGYDGAWCYFCGKALVGDQALTDHAAAEAAIAAAYQAGLEAGAAKERERCLPKEPPPGLLMSMAIRYDHGLGMHGYYDTTPIQFGPSHQKRLESTLSTMRQLYEEVSGHGFYSPDKEAGYAAAIRAGREG